MYWSKTTTHNHIILPMVLVLPFWVCPGQDKAFPAQQCKLSTMQALAGTHPACADAQQQGRSSSHKKSRASLWTLFVPSHGPRYQGLLLHAAEGSQPVLSNGASRDSSSHQWAWQPHSCLLYCPAPGSNLQTPQERREKTLTGSRALTNITLLRRDTPAFQESQFKFTLTKTWTETVLYDHPTGSY